jgi:thiol-disulfide isomerase/thioredoxin
LRVLERESNRSHPREMSVESEVSTEQTIAPQVHVTAGLDLAAGLQRAGKLSEAATELERALATARATPYEIEFQTRIRLGMTLSDVYLSLDQIQDARDLLADEVAFAEKISEIMRATGTPAQRRAATSGYLQVRDRATQLALIGQTAPDITVKTWIKGGPVALEDLRGRVVLLEFWATWCRPCQEMFPKLKSLHEQESLRGLEITAITRHYMAYGGTDESIAEELQLISAMVTDHGVSFAVGVAEDERLQAIYGANGLPTVVLIDRQGVVRYAGPGGEDPGFDEMLQQCLNESV